MSERLLCYAKWTVVSFVIDQLIWIYILQWWLKQQCACTCNHVAPLPVSVPTRFCIHYSKILYVLSGEAANTNFSHWLHPDAERTRGLLHSSRALSTTSLGWSYTLIDINGLCIQCRRRAWRYQRGKQFLNWFQYLVFRCLHNTRHAVSTSRSITIIRRCLTQSK